MKKNYILNTKEINNREKNRIQIQKAIDSLKIEYKKYTTQRIGELYRILSKIVSLRKETKSRYTERSLEWEKDIELNAMQIRHIFAYQSLTSYTLKLIKENKISDNVACAIICRSSLLKQTQNQNKIINLFLEGKITSSQIAELTKEEVKLLLQGKLKFRKDEKYFLTAVKTLRSITSRINERKNILKNSKYRKGLLNQVNRLKELIEE